MSLTVIFMMCGVFQLFPHQLRMAVRLSQCPIEHQPALQPSLVASEPNQAFLTAEYQPGTVNISQSHQKMTELRLRSLFEDRNIRLGEEMDDDALVILFDLGLDSRLPALANVKLAETESKLSEHRGLLEVALENTTIQHILDCYGLSDLASDTLWKLGREEVNASTEILRSLGKLSPQLHAMQKKGLQNMKLNQLPDESQYKRRKDNFLIVAHILEAHDKWEELEKRRLVDAIMSSDALHTAFPSWLLEDSKGKSKHNLSSTVPKKFIRRAKEATWVDMLSDDTFIQRVPVMCDKEPLLLDAALRIGKIILGILKRKIGRVVQKVYAELHRSELDQIQTQIRQQARITADNEKISSRVSLIQEINDSYDLDFTVCALTDPADKQYEVFWEEEIQTPAHLQYTVHLLGLTTDDKQKLCLESGYDYVPRPQFRTHPPEFSLPVGHHICGKVFIPSLNFYGDTTVFQRPAGRGRRPRAWRADSAPRETCPGRTASWRGVADADLVWVRWWTVVGERPPRNTAATSAGTLHTASGYTNERERRALVQPAHPVRPTHRCEDVPRLDAAALPCRLEAERVHHKTHIWTKTDTAHTRSTPYAAPTRTAASCYRHFVSPQSQHPALHVLAIKPTLAWRRKQHENVASNLDPPQWAGVGVDLETRDGLPACIHGWSLQKRKMPAIEGASQNVSYRQLDFIVVRTLPASRAIGLERPAKDAVSNGLDASVGQSQLVFDLITSSLYEVPPIYIPCPVTEYQVFNGSAIHSGHFRLIKTVLSHVQLFQNNRCLMTVSDDIDALNNVIKADHTNAVFSHTKLGSDVRIAVDEARAFLVLVSSDGSNACRLHIYRLMEKFSTLAARGTPMTLYSWHDGPLRITDACFVSGQEEIFLVDNREGRIYSFVTQQWRPATLHLIQQPSAIFSTPDGACLVAVERDQERFRARVYHWASFGSNAGLVVDLPDIQPTSFGITSLAQRNVVHALVLSPSRHMFRSVSLQITRQSSEFMFRQQEEKQKHKTSTQNYTQHNSLIDCHRESWTRFPVVPAVSRSTIRPGSRATAWLQFVTEDRSLHQRFAPYWRDMITSFETSTRKPTEGVLLGCFVSGTDLNTLSRDGCQTSSEFHAGEWLVELLCLIPIQICITRDNRFIPLKDGVWSPDLERSLLGADLSQVVESISFGWYEGLLQSYYRGKKVKSPQPMNFLLFPLTLKEWILLNVRLRKVLFRNNFVVSRDIATSIQSFQSSSLVLNPASNPTLFQGKLAIIDVIDSDSKEIVKEFSEKLHRIVMEEQDSNFITRLHKEHISIIPWPVIESNKFYSMFHQLKKVLYSQPITHPGAGVFLSTMKTLMAKLKVPILRRLSTCKTTHRILRMRLRDWLPYEAPLPVNILERIQDGYPLFVRTSAILAMPASIMFMTGLTVTPLDSLRMPKLRNCSGNVRMRLSNSGQGSSFAECSVSNAALFASNRAIIPGITLAIQTTDAALIVISVMYIVAYLRGMTRNTSAPGQPICVANLAT
ncbi:hypothetical protein JB92DRAFT_2835852 [Gautieria morchelliformis]|nr:hypothetical protein JB92DRAFT_2835852 [Gautieria morchelliformis]